METDKELIAAHLEGDSSAFEKLVNRHMSALYNFVRRFTRNGAEADDITQDTFVKAWKKLHTFKSDERLRPWLYEIARNSAIDYLRTRKSVALSSFETDDGNNVERLLADEGELQDALFEKAENAKKVMRLIEELPEEISALFYMRIHEELTFEEIARVFGKPLNTVKSTYRRALEGLRKRLS